MKLENGVCALKYSKRLRKLGVKQKSLFWYVVKESSLTKKPVGSLWYWKEEFSGQEICSAFTVAELGEMLPRLYLSSQVAKGEKPKWCVFPKIVADERANWGDERIVRANTEANARAKMLIHLLEKGLIK